jgi:hypothetical protein
LELDQASHNEARWRSQLLLISLCVLL